MLFNIGINEIQNENDTDFVYTRKGEAAPKIQKITDNHKYANYFLPIQLALCNPTVRHTL